MSFNIAGLQIFLKDLGGKPIMLKRSMDARGFLRINMRAFKYILSLHYAVGLLLSETS